MAMVSMLLSDVFVHIHLAYRNDRRGGLAVPELDFVQISPAI